MALAADRAVDSAHDLSDGGLAVAIAESAFGSEDFTARIALDSFAPAEYALFGESGARAIVTAKPTALARVMEIAAKYKVGARRIGEVARGDLRIELNGVVYASAAVSALRDIWANALERALQTP